MLYTIVRDIFLGEVPCVWSNKCLLYFMNNATIHILYNDFYSILVHVMAVYFSHHQKETLAHKYKIPHTLYQSMNKNEQATRMQTDSDQAKNCFKWQ